MSYQMLSGDSEKKRITHLILQVRKGSPADRQTAFEELLQRYDPLIRGLVGKFSDDPITHRFYEDLRQEATVVFYNSILAYDTDQTEVDFGLYAKICISNALVSQLRMLKRRVAEPLAESECEQFFIHETEDPSESILEQERVEALCLIIRNNLSAFEYRVWRYYMSGRTASEIGALLGKDEKSISNAVYRIRKKLRTVLQ